MSSKRYGGWFLIVTAVIWISLAWLAAQGHYAEGDRLVRGNRLISVKSGPGELLYQPVRIFVDPGISVDGKRTEPAWEQAVTATPFRDGNGDLDATSVRVLYDQENIYLFWEIREEKGIRASLTEADGVITSDDYLQVDLRPWLPDGIPLGRDYYYTVAVNPLGTIWDAYFDPYLDGFFFSSWNSGAEVKVVRDGDSWAAEIVIPYSGLDLYSDPGWKWNLEFFHGSSEGNGETRVSTANIGLTVEQDVMVRRPGLVSYYWSRPDFMEEVKPDRKEFRERTLPLQILASGSGEGPRLWEDLPLAEIGLEDRTGKALESAKAGARAGINGDRLCFRLEADGGGIDESGESASRLGEGMAAQMSDVNGVFVDPAIFERECFWIILQPRDSRADPVHQDYYHLIVDNRGTLRGTRYDRYGAPAREWVPQASVYLFETESGWGAEIALDLSCLDLPVCSAADWGLNLFRNRLLEDGSTELQAWRQTGNDYFNPVGFGRLEGVPRPGKEAVLAGLRRRIAELDTRLASVPAFRRDEALKLRADLDRIMPERGDDPAAAEEEISLIDAALGIIDAAGYYASVPHPVSGGYPLMDVRFIGEKGWAVGAMGTILRTGDSGENWEEVSLESDSDLYRVDFADELNGWAAGGRIRIAEQNQAMRHDRRGGLASIYHTADGGRTWTCQYGERGRLLFGLDFIDSTLGFACGERGILLKTEDGGATWMELNTSGTLKWLYGISFLDRDHGFAVGQEETVIRTADGGRTWSRIEASSDRRPYGFKPIYRDITFNGDTGCIVGQNGSLLVSHDRGETWEPSGTFFKPEIRDLMDLRRVTFPTPRLGYAVGELGTQLMVTEDGGESWTYRPLPDTEWLRAVWADPGGRVVLAGEREKVMVSPDKGYDWRTTRGTLPKADILVLLAHGDDAPINLNALFAHYCINQGRTIVEAGVMSDTHSSEYEETYNLEHDRNMWMTGVRTTTNFNEFETGNNGSDYYHFTERLWEGEGNVTRHMVAAIRAYRPDIVITHGGVFGDYDKPGHKLSGRAGLPAFESAGGAEDRWPDLTRLGLAPWQPKKLYMLASESYPMTLELSSIAAEPLQGTSGTCLEFGEYVIRNFQSQGVYHARIGRLSLVRSLVKVPEKERSVFDGLE